MRIATYNVNSIRSRQARILDWMVREDVDVVAMQEIKCTEAQFPFEAFEAAGYEVVLHGLNQWNGVAIASRLPITDVQIGFEGQPGFSKDGPDDAPIEARAIGATVNGVRLWSLYVPNGRALGDPHLDYKLDWFAHLAGATADWIAAHPDEPIALMGDFNVAPFDIDNGDPTVIPGLSTHVSEPERAAFHALEAIGLTDVVRPLVPEGLFTYWDYKQLRFPRNEGMRIDFILGSPTFADRVTAAQIHRNERKGDGPSDHVPVSVDLDLAQAEDDDDRPMIF
jgi:exodeoxyribonuclease III